MFQLRNSGSVWWYTAPTATVADVTAGAGAGPLPGTTPEVQVGLGGLELGRASACR